MDNRAKNIQIAGAGRIEGGRYAEVKTAGSAHINGPLTCDSLRTAGSTRFSGDVVTGACSVSGSAHFLASLTADTLSGAGSTRIDKDLTVHENAKLSGSSRIGGKVKAQELHIAGSANIEGGAECETFICSGAFTVGGLLNAETVQIKLGGACKADEIGGGTVSVKRQATSQLNLFGISINLNNPIGALEANTIEAMNISLENTTAKIVRGETIEIGEGCHIERVEYSSSLILAEGAQVVEQIKVE